MKIEKPIIEYFRVVSKYNISGGITNIEWKVRNHFISIIHLVLISDFIYMIQTQVFSFINPEKLI